MSSNDIAIAVGSAGSATGLGVLKSLRAWKTPIKLLACDTNPAHLVAASSEFDFLQVPPASNADFAEVLASALENRGISSFFPIHDAEVAAASGSRAVFENKRIRVLASDHSSIGLSRDKFEMAQTFQNAGIPTPETRLLNQSKWTGEKLHCKPRTGVGSHGATEISDEEALRTLKRSTNASSLIVQPFIEGQEITVDAFCAEPGENVTCACRERVEVKAGVSTKARLFQDDALSELTAQVSRVLGLTGSFCHQVRGTPEDGWQVIDVNPRVGGGTSMSVAVGYDFPSAHAAQFLNLDPMQFFRPSQDGDVFIVRSYQEHVTWPRNP